MRYVMARLLGLAPIYCEFLNYINPMEFSDELSAALVTDTDGDAYQSVNTGSTDFRRETSALHFTGSLNSFDVV